MLRSFLLITFGFSWFFWLPQALVSNNVTNNNVVVLVSNFSNLGAWGPFIATVVVLFKFQGLEGIKKMYKQTICFDYQKSWLVSAIFLFPVIIGLPLLFSWLINNEVPNLELINNPFVLLISFLIIFFNSGPVQEEFGWRGVMQTNLQERFSPLFSSILVGITWGIWHLPLFFMPNQGFYYDKPIWGLLISTTLTSVLFGWIYNNTNKNMMLMLLFHAMYNFSHYLFPTLESENASLIYMIFLITSVFWVITRSGKNLNISNYH